MNFHVQNLPHFTPNDAPYFVTTRLAGSLPRSILDKLQRDHVDLIRRKQRGNLDSEEPRQLQKRYFAALDNALDKCLSGPTWLRQPEIAEVVKQNLHRLDEDGITTQWCFTIMPNHIHVLFRLDTGELSEAMQLAKGRSAFEANKLLARRGSFWQQESYDHVMRENEFARIVRYILLNPVKAGLCSRWQEWPWTYLHPSIFGFDDINPYLA